MEKLQNRVARRRGPQGGFTLIELLVVIAVLGVLAAIVIFNVTGVANKGKQNACQTDKQTVQTAVDAYYNDHNSYPASGGTVDQGALVADNKMHTQSAYTFNIDTSNGTVTAGAGDPAGC